MKWSRLYSLVVDQGTGSGWRLPALDGLRAVAALMVLASHVLAATTPDSAWWLAPVERGGIGGVVLFFALSGFLLYLPWLRASLEHAPPPRFRVYAARRCLRIMPAYYASVVAFASLRIVLGGKDPIPGWAIALHFVFLPTLGFSLQTVYWTLQVEEFFYWLLPAIHRFIERTSFRIVFAICVAVAAIWCAVGFVAIDASARAVWMAQTPLFLPAFVLGIYTAIRWKSPQVVSGRALLVGGLLLYALPSVAYRTLALMDETWVPLTGLAIAPAACAAVLAAARGAAPVLEHPALRFLGGISFSIYLWHLAVIKHVPCPSFIAHHFVPRLAFTLVFTIPVSLLTFLLIERPFLRMRPRTLSATQDQGAT